MKLEDKVMRLLEDPSRVRRVGVAYEVEGEGGVYLVAVRDDTELIEIPTPVATCNCEAGRHDVVCHHALGAMARERESRRPDLDPERG